MIATEEKKETKEATILHVKITVNGEVKEDREFETLFLVGIPKGAMREDGGGTVCASMGNFGLKHADVMVQCIERNISKNRGLMIVKAIKDMREDGDIGEMLKNLGAMRQKPHQGEYATNRNVRTPQIGKMR